jgi:hypothetical protein
MNRRRVWLMLIRGRHRWCCSGGGGGGVMSIGGEGVRTRGPHVDRRRRLREMKRRRTCSAQWMSSDGNKDSNDKLSLRLPIQDQITICH